MCNHHEMHTEMSMEMIKNWQALEIIHFDTARTNIKINEDAHDFLLHYTTSSHEPMHPNIISEGGAIGPLRTWPNEPTTFIYGFPRLPALERRDGARVSRDAYASAAVRQVRVFSHRVLTVLVINCVHTGTD